MFRILSFFVFVSLVLVRVVLIFLLWFCLVEDFWATPDSVTLNVGFKKADDELLAQWKTEVHNEPGKRKRNKKQLKLANADSATPRKQLQVALIVLRFGIR